MEQNKISPKFILAEHDKKLVNDALSKASAYEQSIAYLSEKSRELRMRGWGIIEEAFPQIDTANNNYQYNLETGEVVFLRGKKLPSMAKTVLSERQPDSQF